MSTNDGDLDRVARLDRRRLRRAGNSVVCLVALGVYGVLDRTFLQDLTGTAKTISVIPLFALLAATIVVFVMTLADSVQLRRYGREDRERARRARPQGGRKYAGGIIIVFCLALITLPILPREVNDVGYLVGAEQLVSFRPVHHAVACGDRSGCMTVTVGHISGSVASVQWPRDVPLGKDFPVRMPLWDWGTGRVLTTGDLDASLWLAVGLFFNGLSALSLAIGLRWLRSLLKDPGPEPDPQAVTSGTGSYPEWLLRENRMRAASRDRRKR